MIYPQSIVYALEALGYLASLEPNETEKVKHMAKSLKMPEHFLGKVLTELVKKKFITSTKGPSGGFKLSPNTKNITIFRLLASLDGLTVLEDNCIMGLKECSNKTPCSLHDILKKFREEAIQKMEEVTLADFSNLVMVKLHLGT